MQRKLRDCFDLARELFAYAHHSGTEESVREFEKLKAQFDREVRRRASARPPKRPVLRLPRSGTSDRALYVRQG